MKIWNVDFKYKDENGVWTRPRVIAKDYVEAAEKAWKVADFGKDKSDFRISRIEEEEEELDSI